MELKLNRLKQIAAVAGIGFLLAGCSQDSKQVSQEKKEINNEKEAQMQLIDQRAKELKFAADLRDRQTKDAIKVAKERFDQKKGEATAQSIGDAKKQLDSEQKVVDDYTGLVKKDVDNQVKTDKAQVDLNVKDANRRLEAVNKQQKLMKSY